MTNPDLITLTVRHGGLSAGTAADPNPEIAASQVEARNTVGGPVVEYDVDLHPSGPFETVRFAHGSIEAPVELRRVKLLRDHEDTNPVGVLTRWDPAGAVVDASFRLGRHPKAVEAAGLVEDEILDGFSVGIIPTEYHHDDAGTAVVTRAHLREVSLVAIPAISTTRARLGAAERKDPGMTGTPAPAAPAPAPTPTAPPEVADAAMQARIDALLATRIDAMMAAATAPAAAAPLPDGATGAGTEPVTADARTTDGRIVATDRPSQYAAARGNDGRMYTAGDFLAAFALGATSGDWSKHKAITAALADETTTEVPGLLPYAIVGELLGRQNGRRPLWDSFRSRSMPMMGTSFGRPRITQHVKVDVQETQKTEVATQQLKVLLDDVKKTTIAGGLDVAQQAIDWSSPSLLNELVADFISVYIRYTDAYAAKTLVAATTGTGHAVPVEWDGTAGTIAGVLATAAGQVYSSLGADEDAFPNTAWCSVDMWVALAGLADKTDRAMFPALGPANAYGRTDLARPDQGMRDTGFNWVVDKNLPTGSFIIGDAQLCETYENGRRLLQAVVPGVLGLDLAYMGYVASYMPYPKTLVPIKVKKESGGGSAPAKG
jgi:HK97 family phage prohead protease